MWHPYGSMETHYSEARYYQLLRGELKVWNSFDPVQFDETIDWNMDPFGNQTWGLYFNSLNWLYSLYWGYYHGKEDYTRMHDIVLDYCRYLESKDVNEMAWFDHSTSDRLCFLSTLFSHPMFQAFPQESQELMIKVTFDHISKIRDFYDSKFWFNSNHGVFHALAILNIAQITPFSKSDYGLEPFGLIYLETSLRKIISISDAYTLEQSVYYHQLALSLLKTIPHAIYEKTSFDGDLTRLIPDMIESNYWVTTSGAAMVSLGDTAYAANIPREYSPNHLPKEKFRTFPDCGFSIFKSRTDENRYDHVSFLHQHHRAPHGHFDALSITIAHNNIPFVVDSGGPYKYGDPFRFTYFMSNRAHNNIVLNNKVHQAGAEGYEYATPCEGVHQISSSHLGYDPTKISRELFIFENRGVLVIDKIDGLTAPTDVQSIWHFAPEAIATLKNGTVSIENSGLEMDLHSSLSEQLNHSIVEGVEGKSPQGWVTKGNGLRSPTPTLVSSMKAKEGVVMGWFFSFNKQNNFTLDESAFTISHLGKNLIVSFGKCSEPSETVFN